METLALQNVVVIGSVNADSNMEESSGALTMCGATTGFPSLSEPPQPPVPTLSRLLQAGPAAAANHLAPISSPCVALVCRYQLTSCGALVCPQSRTTLRSSGSLSAGRPSRTWSRSAAALPRPPRPNPTHSLPYAQSFGRVTHGRWGGNKVAGELPVLIWLEAGFGAVTLLAGLTFPAAPPVRRCSHSAATDPARISCTSSSALSSADFLSSSLALSPVDAVDCTRTCVRRTQL